jgi:hypothetical protein
MVFMVLSLLAHGRPSVGFNYYNVRRKIFAQIRIAGCPKLVEWYDATVARDT